MVGGIIVQQNSIVNVVISAGAEMMTVPQVTNMPNEEAVALLEELGFVVIKIEAFSNATGVCQSNTTDPTVLYDYVAVLYPEGQLASNANFMFNHNRISDVIFKGYENPEREDFIRYLNQAHENQDANTTDNEESGDS